MKKAISILMCLCLILSTFTFVGITASAENENGFYYTVENGEATITDYSTSISGAITIPSTLGGYPVTSIGRSAFFGCSSLTSVTIPDSVTSIGYEAFYYCYSLTSVTIPDSVTSIGDYAFYYCSSLTSVTIPDSVTSIGCSAFEDCYLLTSVTIGNSVTRIGSSAFYGTAYYNNESNWENDVLYIGNHLIKAKTTISGNYTIKNGTKLIANYAFYDCDSLTSVSIPDSVTSIGISAFDGCSSLTTITIPDSVTSIGSSAFVGTAYYNNESNWVNDVLYIGNHLIKAKTFISGNYTIKNGTKLIADDAFYNCDSLTSVSIPDSVTSIGYEAFYNCSFLTSVTIGNSVTSIGDYAFSYCSSLTSITIPDSVTSIGNDAFDDCDALEKVNITNIKAWCEIEFTDVYDNPLSEGCQLYHNGKLLKGDLVIPNGTKSIGAYAFYECESLTSVSIPDSVTSIGSNAFDDCDALEKVNITVIKAWCEIDFFNSYSNPLCNGGNLYLNGTLLKGDLVIPNGTKIIGNGAFRGCSKLTSVSIPDSVTSIGERAFYNCYSLTSVTIPDSVTSIGEDAFYRCSSLTSVTIPDSVTNVGDYAFYGCSKLTSVTIPDSVTNIGEGAFEDCYSLTSVKISDALSEEVLNQLSSQLQNIREIEFSKGTKKITKLMCLNTNISSVLIPDTVTTIEEDAFYKCEDLKSVYIPSSVTEIGAHAFGYYDTGESFDGYDKVDGFAIYGKKGSAAETYAKNNGFKFAEEKHNEVIDEAVEPNCTETGLTEGSHCSACGKVIEAQKVVPAVGHTIVTDKAVKATCTETGLTQGSHCATCKKVIKKQNTVKALGHKYKWVTTKKATYFAKGTSSYKCSVCGEVLKTKSIAKLKLKTPSFKLTGAKGKFTVKYTKVTGATGFEVKYKLGKGKFKTVKVTTKKSLSKVIKKLKKGKYTVQVRAVVKSGKKTAYSNWSKAKTVKVK